MDNDNKPEVNMSQADKEILKEPDAVEEQALDNDYESENKMLSIYKNLVLRLALVSTGLMIFFLAFLKSTRITGFDTTKLILFEICLLVLLVFIIGIAVSLVLLRHECRAKHIISVMVYISALTAMISVLLVWVFFRAVPISMIGG